MEKDNKKLQMYKNINDGLNRMEKTNQRDCRMLLGFLKMIYFKPNNSQFYQKFKQYFPQKK